MPIYQGTTHRSKASFRDRETNALVDPDVVRFEVYLPDKTTVAFVYGVDDVVVRDSVGVYHVDYTFLQLNVYRRKWIATVGTATSKYEPARVNVVPSTF